MKKLLGLVALTGLILALLSACGGKSDHNDADISFASGMVPHHEQAVVMADQALKTSKNDVVRALATNIKAAQDPEITKMKSWLDDWDSHGSMDHGDMGSMGHGEGMMSDDEMKSLDSATGAAFDTAWLNLMIKHHEGAVAMSKTELKDGTSAKAKKLARQIITSQNGEIANMKELLKQ